MKKWQKWLVVGAAAITCISSVGSFINSYKAEEDKTNTDSEAQTACVQVVEG